MSDVTPAAQAAADDAGVNVADVAGTGAAGRVTVADVQAHAAVNDAPRATSADESAPAPIVVANEDRVVAAQPAMPALGEGETLIFESDTVRVVQKQVPGGPLRFDWYDKTGQAAGHSPDAHKPPTPGVPAPDDGARVAVQQPMFTSGLSPTPNDGGLVQNDGPVIV